MSGKAHIYFTRRCNFRCTGCRIRETRPGRELSIGEWRRAFERMQQLGFDTVKVLGGEPTVREDLPQLIRVLNDMKISYTIESNSFAPLEIYKRLLDAGIKGYTTDVHTLGASFGPNDLERKKSEKGLEALNFFKQHGVPLLEANIVVSKRNINELPDIVEELEDMGVWSNLIPLHYHRRACAGRLFIFRGYADEIPEKYKFRTQDKGEERSRHAFRLAEEEVKTIDRVMMKLLKMKVRACRENRPTIINPASFLISFSACAGLHRFHCTTFHHLRMDADGRLLICNDVRGEGNYNILELTPEKFSEFKEYWQNSEERNACCGCFWPPVWEPIPQILIHGLEYAAS